MNSFVKFAQTEDEFSKWFVKEVEGIPGFNLKDMAKMLMPEMLVDTKGLA